MSAQVLRLLHLPFNLQMLQLFLPDFMSTVTKQNSYSVPLDLTKSVSNFYLCIEKEHCRIIECRVENIQAPPPTPSWWRLYRALTTRNVTHSISYLCYWKCLGFIRFKYTFFWNFWISPRELHRILFLHDISQKWEDSDSSPPPKYFSWCLKYWIYYLQKEVGFRYLKIPFPQCKHFRSFCRWVVYS